MTALFWYWGRRGAGGPILEHLVRHLLEAGTSTPLALSLSRQSEDLDRFDALGVPVRLVDTFVGTPSIGSLIRHVPTWRRAFRAVLDEFQPETIVVPMMFAAMVPLLDMARRRTRQLIYVLHDAQAHPGDSGGRLQHIGQAAMLRAADTVVVLSRAVGDMASARSPRLASKIVLQPLFGLYPLEIRPESPRGGRPRVLMEGRLVAYKGFERVARALDLLGADVPVDITIAGDGPYRPVVERLFQGRPGVELRLGWSTHNDRAAMYATHDVLLCPYDEASQSGVICDALRVGMPVIVTPMGALPEQIGFGRAGLLLDDMSPAALARALQALAGDPGLVSRWREGAAALHAECRAALSWPALLGAR